MTRFGAEFLVLGIAAALGLGCVVGLVLTILAALLA